VLELSHVPSRVVVGARTVGRIERIQAHALADRIHKMAVLVPLVADSVRVMRVFHWVFSLKKKAWSLRAT
jgi:hypothetical protein